MMPRTNRTPTRAFSLIELMVVIGIIVVLVAILLPSLSRAREQAYQVKCAAHFRTIGAGIFYYANDRDNGNGYLPQLGRFINLYPGAYWATQIRPYLKYTKSKVDGRHGLLWCPADKNPSYRYITGDLAGRPATRRDKLRADAGQDPSRNTGSRRRGGSGPTQPSNAPLIEPVSYSGSCDVVQNVQWPGANGGTVPRKLLELDRPHCQALMTEAPLRSGGDAYFSWTHIEEALTSTDPSVLKVYRRHYGGMNPNTNGANWLFADGHVEWNSVIKGVEGLLCCQDFGVESPQYAFLQHARQLQAQKCGGPGPGTRRVNTRRR